MKGSAGEPVAPQIMAEAERTLRERARRLAAEPAPTQDGRSVEVLVCRVADEQYAVELGVLQTVHRAQDLTALPCVPPHVAGLVNVRGEVVVVLSLAATLGLGSSDRPAEAARVLLVDLPHTRVGLLVDEVLGIEPLAVDALSGSLSGREAIRGVSESAVALLDLERLLGDARLEVLEEVS